MLVLSRKSGETVRIGQDITITFLRVGGRVTKVGIDAPSSVRVLRGELYGDRVDMLKDAAVRQFALTRPWLRLLPAAFSKQYV
jgi:carbon storage regulator